MDWLTLSGRPALVAGAGGLGGASAVALAAQGATVVLADVDEQRLEAVARTVKNAGGSLRTIAADLRSAERCREVVAEAAALTGGPRDLRARRRPQRAPAGPRAGRRGLARQSSS